MAIYYRSKYKIMNVFNSCNSLLSNRNGFKSRMATISNMQRNPLHTWAGFQCVTMSKFLMCPITCHNDPVPGQYWADAASIGPVLPRYWPIPACFQCVTLGKCLIPKCIEPGRPVTSVLPTLSHYIGIIS